MCDIPKSSLDLITSAWILLEDGTQIKGFTSFQVSSEWIFHHNVLRELHLGSILEKVKLERTEFSGNRSTSKD